MVKPSKHLSQSFELQIWFIATGLASLRGIIGVIDDLIANPLHWDELTVDSTISIIFVILSYRIFTGKLSEIPIWISLLFILLSCINYLQFGGVGNGVEYNLMGLIVLLILAIKARPLQIVLVFYFLIVFLMLLEDQYIGQLSEIFFIENIDNSLDFFLMLVTISLIILYFKQILIKESAKLMEIKTELTEKIKLTFQQNRKLKEQKEYIDIANKRLQEEFINQTGYLMKNNESIEKFIHQMTESIDDPLDRLVYQSESLKSTGTLEQMTKNSIAELNEVIHKLKLQLKEI